MFTWSRPHGSTHVSSTPVLTTDSHPTCANMSTHITLEPVLPVLTLWPHSDTVTLSFCGDQVLAARHHLCLTVPVMIKPKNVHSSKLFLKKVALTSV